MKHLEHYTYYILACCLALALFGCEEDTPQALPQAPEGMLSLRCDLQGITLPETRTASSRATAAEEDKVDEICVFFFRYEGGKSLLTSKVYVTSDAFTMAPSVGSFSANIPYMAGKYNFIAVVANGNYYLGDLVAGQSTLSDFLRTTFDVPDGQTWRAASGRTGVLPMAGAIGRSDDENNSIDLSTSTRALHIPLVRSLAKVEIDNMAGKQFKITGVRVYNQQREGFLYGDGKSLSPNVSALHAHQSPLKYDIQLSNGQSSNGEIYLFEHAKGDQAHLEQAPRIVVKGVFDSTGNGFADDTESYYAIDFTDSVVFNGTDNLSPIRRNTYYALSIVKIGDVGAPSPEAAMKMPVRTNIDYRLATLHGYSKVVFNDLYYYAYDGPDTFHLRRMAEGKKVEWLPKDATPNYFRLLTNHPQGASVRMEKTGANLSFGGGKKELSVGANKEAVIGITVRGDDSGQLTFYLPGQSGFSFVVPVEASPKIRVDCLSNDQGRRGRVTVSGTYNQRPTSATDSCFVDWGSKVTLKAATSDGGVFDQYYRNDGTQILSSDAIKKEYDIGSPSGDVRYQARFGLWARSNVYWDGKKLTFELADYASVPYTGGKNYYQGLLFKWGSLVGIAQDVNYSNANSYLYFPRYDSNSWYGGKRTDASSPSFSSSWSSVPYCTDTGSNAVYDTSVIKPSYNTAANWRANKGDICQYIGHSDPTHSGYRMPKDNEIGSSKDDWTVEWGNSGGVYPDKTGTFSVTHRYVRWNSDHSIVVPVCAYLDYAYGNTNSIDSEGNFWSASSKNNNDAYYFRVVGTGGSFSTSYALQRTYGFAIRCIKM
ncbi:MAG: hypothetical protein LBN29_13265 [Mediterranea sp.]|jgi:hypothetical protein|nr:hypothetical protein [Mediterranea sp.]